MKYDVVLEVHGKKFNYKAVEATNKEDAITKATQQLKRDIMFVSIQPTPEVREDRASNAKQVPPMSGVEMFDKFFGKKFGGN